MTCLFGKHNWLGNLFKISIPSFLYLKYVVEAEPHRNQKKSEPEYCNSPWKALWNDYAFVFPDFGSLLSFTTAKFSTYLLW